MPGAYNSTMPAASSARSTWSSCVVTPCASARAMASSVASVRCRRSRSSSAGPISSWVRLQARCSSRAQLRLFEPHAQPVQRRAQVVRDAVEGGAQRGGLLLDAIQHGVHGHGQRVEFIARTVGAQALGEVAMHDGLAGVGVLAHAARGAARVGGAQQPHAQRREHRAPERRQAETSQHFLPLAGIGAHQQPVAVRQPFDARLRPGAAPGRRARCAAMSNSTIGRIGGRSMSRGHSERLPATGRNCCVGQQEDRAGAPPAVGAQAQRGGDAFHAAEPQVVARSSTSARITAAISRSSTLRVSR